MSGSIKKPVIGFEPMTIRLQGERSTPELHRHVTSIF
jgi:hypothetical protein